MKKIIIKTIIWIFAIIICICVTLYSCREIVTPNYEVVGGSMQKINIKGIELPNKNHGNYYLIVVKLKGANKRKQLFGFKCYLDGITSAINKIRITDDKSELLSDSIRGLDQINRIPYDLLTVEYKDVYQSDSYFKCKMIKHLCDMPYIINNLGVGLCDYPYDNISEIQSFAAIVYIENQKSTPKSISIETESGAFTSKVISKPISLEINEIILKKDK